MRLLLSAALAVSAASVVLGQRPARIGPDGKPLLNRPVMEECQKSEWKYYENFFGRTWLWSSKQSLNFCQNSVSHLWHQVIFQRNILNLRIAKPTTH